MGQSTHGIMYGASFELKDDADDDGFNQLYDLIAGFGHGAGVEFSAEPGEGVCGFWLAVGASGKEGVPFLETTDLAFVRHDNANYAAAEKMWPKLAKAVRAIGITLETSSLWIVETEVA